MKTRKTNKISDNTIRRLPRYLRCLDELERQGNTRVSSAMIGNHLNNTPSQVRQDLSQFGSYGMQGYGYNIESLRASIHAILGTDATHTVIIAGIGSLGHALLEHLPLAANASKPLCCFDADSGQAVEPRDKSVETFHFVLPKNQKPKPPRFPRPPVTFDISFSIVSLARRTASFTAERIRS